MSLAVMDFEMRSYHGSAETVPTFLDVSSA
jgi:hypothetical protein